MFPEYTNNMMSNALESVLRSNVSAMDYFTGLALEGQHALNQYSSEFASKEELEVYIMKAINDKTK